jgi:hypothetical protein
VHPLEQAMSEDGFVLIGDSADGHFPATSFHVYTLANKRFYCLDLGGLTESRGNTAGKKVYPTVADLPKEHSKLALIWSGKASARRAVEAAHEAGCTRVWFSFLTTDAGAVARARELGLEIVELGRCPVAYLAREDVPTGCRIHMGSMKLTGTWQKSPQTDAGVRRRELV